MNTKNISNTVVNLFLIPLLIISICGSISLLPLLIQLVPNKVIIIFVILLMLAYLGHFWATVKYTFIKILNKIKKILVIVFIFATLIWQTLLIRALSGEFGWDPRFFVEYIYRISSNISDDKIYFSLYPNNFMLLVIEKIFQVIFNIKTPNGLILGLNILNVVIIDISALLLFLSIKKLFSRRTAWFTTFLYWILYMIWPFAVIPYSDNWSILVGTLFLFIYSKNQNFKNLFLNFCFGIITAFALLMKPSTVISIIAIVIIKTIFGLQQNQKIKIKRIIEIAVSLGLGFIILYSPVKIYQQHNNIVNIKSTRKMPVTHFIAMGMSGDGGYNASDVIENINIKSPQKRNKYNIKLIQKRFLQMGLGGYLKFLVKKQINNTTDGSFGWAAEGNYLYEPFGRHLNRIEKHIRTLFMNRDVNQGYLIADANMGGYKFFPQIIWVVALVFMLFATVGDSGETLQFLKYTIVGGFVFLLLFEGGRSRYLIQFLPYLFTLSGLGIDKFISKYKDEKVGIS